MKLDVTIVAGRRPELLRATLDSFFHRALAYHDVQNAFVNIDPIFGNEADADACIKAVKDYFASPVIFTPDKAGFGAAVKRLWSRTTSDYVMHLEDDWLVLEEIDSRVEACFLSKQVKQVSFHTANQRWDIVRRGNCHRRRRYMTFMGIRFPLPSTYPIFTTSPSIIDGQFARMSAELMNPTFDPEKQFYYGVNSPLERAVAKYDNFIFSPNRRPLIVDTGREWRGERGISKNIRNGISVWE
ncbi:MAG: hypothetical protein KK478_19615 [Ensifer alkalisoli]|nr:hypothetical protein [Sinorhizobium alkalisoli]